MTSTRLTGDEMERILFDVVFRNRVFWLRQDRYLYYFMGEYIVETVHPVLRPRWVAPGLSMSVITYDIVSKKVVPEYRIRKVLRYTQVERFSKRGAFERAVPPHRWRTQQEKIESLIRGLEVAIEKESLGEADYYWTALADPMTLEEYREKLIDSLYTEYSQRSDTGFREYSRNDETGVLDPLHRNTRGQ